MKTITRDFNLNLQQQINY